MAKQSVHAVPYDGQWATKVSNVDYPVSIHQTQSAAAEHGRQLAQMMGTELFIHRPNGQIRDRNSYGNDPFPPPS
ncbi:MAG: DUF2188 domain-containing protein [Gemmatimonadota bacterium]|nr:DUF2188 domain-containing protein [Gemmatimonadota bacterium]